MSDQIGTRSGAGSWYVVHCKPLKELQTEATLKKDLDVETYVPAVISRVRGHLQEVPFFPGYLFVNCDLNEVALSSINFTPGVVRVLSFGDGPQAVPRVLISTIKERLEALNAQGGLPSHNFHPGDTVVLKSGPFRGLNAVFVGPTTPSARVQILLELLGRINEVKVDVECLTQADSQPAPRRQRGTRGRGRRVRAAGVV